ncbi:MAG: fumarylacetoacetate hydrolase family protein, partial [Woeseiaceae bacterium]
PVEGDFDANRAGSRYSLEYWLRREFGGIRMIRKRVASAAALACIVFSGATSMAADITRYVRYSTNDQAHYGIVDGDQIRQLDGAPWHGGEQTGKSVAASAVTLLAPAEPSKVIAVGYNYVSHREDMTHVENRPIPEYPPLFLKLPTTITGPDTDVEYPADANDVHFEGELVIVIGKTASKVSLDDAGKYIFGVTAGNDISERSWQANDLQWFRAKGTDGFGPLGPAIVTGLNYLDLRVQTRLNGKTMQDQSSIDQIHNPHAVLSYISQYVTLHPGDIIYTGTPGATSAMQPGDTVEIEVEGVGVLKNRIVASIDSAR